MRLQSKIFSMVALAAMVGVSAAFTPAEPDIKKAKLGEKAPAFTLENLKGDKISLNDYAGKIVVLEWYNPSCPFCVGIYEKGVVKNMLAELKAIDKDFVYLAIDSVGNKPQTEVEKECAKLVKDHKIDINVLIDYEGDVARAFDARTTPHMFVIDGKGVLRYEGAITDDGRFKKGEKATNYVVNAVKQIVAGETVSPDQVKSWGCGVKGKLKKKDNSGKGNSDS